MVFVFSLSFSQSKVWTKKNSQPGQESISRFHLEPSNVKMFNFNSNLFQQRIQSAPLRGKSNAMSSTIIEIPNFNGDLESFRIYESQIFESSLAEQFPEIKSYVGYGVENPQTRLSMSVSPKGVQTMITSNNRETMFMQPITHGSNDYMVYTKSSRGVYEDTFICSTIDDVIDSSENRMTTSIQRDADDQTLRSYRLAVSVNGEYTTYHGGTVAGALEGINATLTRVNAVFETDMAITFVLVDAPELIFTNANTDPYSNNLGAWNVQLQNTLTNTIGNDAYDIGHMFGASGGGGNAGCIGCVCEDDSPNPNDENKGAGITSPSDGIPETDTFDIDYVAHEIGHQMGANHTWSFASEGTGVNVEPGSGTTIMGYAGITGSDDVQNNSDAYFHYVSINQILNNVATAPNNCAVTTTISNNPPVANAGPNYVIPNGTAYILKGSATDADGSDMLSYCWEQNNSGVVTSGSFGPTSTGGATTRSLPPSSSPNRYIPKLERVLNGQLTETNPSVGSDWETVSNVGRSMQWALTVRDRDASATGLNGQSSFDLMNMTVSGSAGPFVVTSQNDGALWLSGTNQMITWDVAGTTGNGINTSNVNILLSTDGGQTFDTILVADTANDGSEMIAVPNIVAPYCRIMVEPVGNIYYAVNSAEFSLNAEVETICTQYASGDVGEAIPDGPGGNGNPGPAVENIINIPDSEAIDFIKVYADVSHDYINDLIIEVIHPDGTTSTNIYNRNCGSQDDLDVIFSDGSPAIVCASPTTGEYRPSSPLSVFSGLDSSGDWTMSITDNWDAITGTFNDWYIEVCSTTITPLSVDEFAIGAFSVFPNPNKGEFTIKLNSNSNQDISVDVVDIRGRRIFNNVYSNNSDFNQVVTLNNAQAGLYLVTVSDGDKKATRKIVIE